MPAMTESITLMIEGDPVQWARAGRSGKFSFTPKRQAIHMDVIRIAAARVFKGPPLEGPLSVAVNFIYQWPKSLSEKKRRIAGAHWKTSRADLDNCFKIVGDSLNKVVWSDDAQITELRLTKQFGLSSATYIFITPLVTA